MLRALVQSNSVASPLKVVHAVSLYFSKLFRCDIFQPNLVVFLTNGLRKGKMTRQNFRICTLKFKILLIAPVQKFYFPWRLPVRLTLSSIIQLLTIWQTCEEAELCSFKFSGELSWLVIWNSKTFLEYFLKLFPLKTIGQIVFFQCRSKSLHRNSANKRMSPVSRAFYKVSWLLVWTSNVFTCPSFNFCFSRRLWDALESFSAQKIPHRWRNCKTSMCDMFLIFNTF